MCFEFLDPIGNHSMFCIVQGSRSRKKRRRMAVITHSQEHEIKSWQPSEEFLQYLRIFVGCNLRIEFAFNAENLRLVQRDFGKHSLFGHSVIAVRVIRWNTSFIAP